MRPWDIDTLRRMQISVFHCTIRCTRLLHTGLFVLSCILVYIMRAQGFARRNLISGARRENPTPGTGCHNDLFISFDIRQWVRESTATNASPCLRSGLSLIPFLLLPPWSVADGRSESTQPNPPPPSASRGDYGDLVSHSPPAADPIST